MEYGNPKDGGRGQRQVDWSPHARQCGASSLIWRGLLSSNLIVGTRSSVLFGCWAISCRTPVSKLHSCAHSFSKLENRNPPCSVDCAGYRMEY